MTGFDVHTPRVVQGLHPSLAALFNELAAAQSIPTPVRTGANGWTGTEPKSLNGGQRPPERCFLSLSGLAPFGSSQVFK